MTKSTNRKLNNTTNPHLFQAGIHFFYHPIMEIECFFLEVPLNSKCWIYEEALIIVSIIDEVVAYLNLATYAEMIGNIVPELRL